MRIGGSAADPRDFDNLNSHRNGHDLHVREKLACRKIYTGHAVLQRPNCCGGIDGRQRTERNLRQCQSAMRLINNHIVRSQQQIVQRLGSNAGGERGPQFRPFSISASRRRVPLQSAQLQLDQDLAHAIRIRGGSKRLAVRREIASHAH